MYRQVYRYDVNSDGQARDAGPALKTDNRYAGFTIEVMAGYLV